MLAHAGAIAALVVVTSRERVAEQDGRPVRIAVAPATAEAFEEVREELEPVDDAVREEELPTFEDSLVEEDVARVEPEPLDATSDTPAPRTDDRFAPRPSKSLGGAPFTPPIEREPVEVPVDQEPVEPQPVEPQPPTLEEPPAPDVEGEAEAAPELLHAPPPAYPRLARRRGWEGSALIELTLAADGSVSAAELVDSTGRDVLDDAALEAVRTWRFVEGGAGRRVRHRVTFTLE